MIGSFRLPVSAAASTSSWAPPADWINISSVANNEIHLLVKDQRADDQDYGNGELKDNQSFSNRGLLSGTGSSLQRKLW